MTRTAHIQASEEAKEIVLEQARLLNASEEYKEQPSSELQQVVELELLNN
jgi:hypothetical protein